MKAEGQKSSTKRRAYQVAKEFKLSNEELIDFLKSHNKKIRNHMALINEDLYSLIFQHFHVEEDIELEKGSDFRKRIQEKKEEEEARIEAIRHEIDEVLERSKGSTFETVEVIPRVKAEVKPTPKKAKKTAGDDQLTDAQKKKQEAEDKSEKKKEKDKKEVSIDEAEEKPKRHLKRRPKVEKIAGKKEEDDELAMRRGKKPKKKSVEQKISDEEQKKKRKKKKRKRKKSAVVIDEKEIEASIKETLARMSETPKRKRRKKDRDVEEVEMEDTNIIKTTEFTSVAELANLMDVESSDVITACMSLGLMVTINQRLDKDTITMVADEFGCEVEFLSEYGDEDENAIVEAEEDPKLLALRPPVVTIMGHVDHGKTSLLDYIRESNIIAGESGGITQHIGAYEVEIDNKKITFLDTPGHEAFTAMRARGAQITDIVVLVVAADDNVMPQTIEAINHARAAGVPMIIAINKMDKPTANPEQIKQQLSEQNVLVEDWGGKTQSASISAKSGEGIQHLLEIILLEAELLELKANPNTNARAVVVEVRMDKGKGVVGTVLVQKGTLKIGDPFVAGQFHGRVRAMLDERNRPVEEAPPSTPVQVLGFNGMPQAGDTLTALDSEQEAREIGLKRQQLKREQSFRQIKRLTLDQISKQIAEGEVKELSIIIKADVDGSIEAISDSLMGLTTEDVTVRIIHKGVGTITESDVLLAEASSAVIIGFHVSPNSQAKELAQKENIDIRLYDVIYDIVNDIKLALSGLLEPERTEAVVGTIEIRELFKASKIGLIAGSYVTSGKVHRNDFVRLKRDEKILYEGKLSSLKRFKDDVKEVASGYECGITLENYNDLHVGDTLEAYQIIETARTI